MYHDFSAGQRFWERTAGGERMTAHNRVEITIETERLLIIRRRRTFRAWCQECGCEVDMVSAGEAELPTGMAGQTLRDGAEARGWHIAQGRDGTEMVCLVSLLKSK
jgi:hypothetical protein